MAVCHLLVEKMYGPSGMVHEELVGIFQGGNRPAKSACRLRHDVWMTSDVGPERNDILWLDEVKRRKSMLINAY